MSPNSRPPLTSRIRASFEGKRTKPEVTSPIGTNGFITQDPDAFRNAINDAINSEAFQTAIAANLARIIQPSIKDALDTLQPLVESVYTHEVLLRKTNRSVENLLERIDTQQSQRNGQQTPKSPSSPSTPTAPTPRRRGSSDSSPPQDIEQFKQSLEKNNKRTVATIAELSSAVESNNRKVTELALGITNIQTFTEQSTTTASVLQAQLDQLKEDIGLVVDSVGLNLGKNVETINQQVAGHPSLLASHATKLDAISTDLVGLKGAADISEKIQTISAELEALKASVESGISASNEHFEGLGAQVGGVLTAVESHAGALTEIKGASTSPEIMEALQKSNDSHASHAVLLGEIKDRSLNSGTEPVAASTGGDSDSSAALQSLQSELTTIKESVEAGFASTGENLSGLSSKVDTVLSTVEEHKSADNGADILAAVQKSNDSHASHAEALEGVKSLGGGGSDAAPISYDTNFSALESQIAALHTKMESIPGGDAAPASYDTNFAALEAQLAELHSKMESHSGSLEQIKSIGGGDATPAPSYDTNFAALEAQIAALHAKMEAHSGSLDEIKSANTPTSREVVPAEGGGNVGELQNELTAIIGKLDTQTGLINELKDDVSAEILTALHDLGQAQAGHTTMLAEVREADVSAEILTALHSSNESHAGHIAAFEKLDAAVQASNDSHATHSTAFDEIKSTRSVEGGAPAGDSSDLESHITALAATLEEHKTTLAEIKDATNASNESHAAHVVSLDDIKSRSVETPPAAESTNLAPLEAQVGAVLAALDDHKTTLSAIHEATTASNESHAAHTVSLGELKTTRSVEPTEATPSGDVGALETQIGSIITTLEEQNATLATIKDTTTASHELHNTHATTLNEIKEATAAANESHAAHTTAFADLKTVQPREASTSEEGSPDVAALETHLNAIIGTLEEQNGTLADIKGSNPDVLAAIKANHDILTSYSPLLETIKDGISHEEVLSGISELKATVSDSKSGVDAHGALVKDLHEETKNANSEIVLAIGALALGGAAGAGTAAVMSDDDSSKEVLEEVKAVRALIETSSASIDATKESVTSIVSQIDINHTTITTSISTLSDELKAEIDATGTQLTDSIAGLSGNVLAIDMTTLDGQLKDLSTSIEATGGKVDVLSEGVHFNEKGIDQLKEHSVAGDRGAPISEAAWFKKSTPAVSREASEPSDDIPEKEYNYLTPVAEENTPEKEDSPVPEAEVVEEAVPEPVVEEAIPEEPIVEEEPTIEEQPIVEEPIVEQPVAEEDPVIEEPIVEKAIVEEPVIEEEPPVSEEIVEEAVPEPEEPAIEEIAEEKLEDAAQEPEPAVEEPIIENEPVAEDIIDKAITDPEESIIEEPAIEEEPIVEEPAIEEPAEEKLEEIAQESEPVVEEPIVEEKPVIEEEPIFHATEEPEDPFSEEKIEEAIEEPVIEDPIVEEAIPEPIIEDVQEPTPELEIEEPIVEKEDPVLEQEPEIEAPAEDPIEDPIVEKEPEIQDEPIVAKEDQVLEKEPEIEVVAEDPIEESIVEEEPEIEPIVAKEDRVLEKEPEIQATAEDPIEEPIIEKEPLDDEPEAIPEDAPPQDDEWALPTKKSKKDKKGKKNSKSGFSTPVTPIEEPTMEKELIDDEPEELPEASEAPQENPDEEWALPTKKSKKEKKGKKNSKSGFSTPATPMTPANPDDEDPFNVASPMSPMSPGGDTEASTSAFASPTSADFPLSPGGKKGKKEKKGKKGKKEKVPFSMDGDEPEE